jgi:hypothetical protein
MRPYEAPKRKSVQKRLKRSLVQLSIWSPTSLSANFEKAVIASLRVCSTLFKDIIQI